MTKIFADVGPSVLRKLDPTAQRPHANAVNALSEERRERLEHLLAEPLECVTIPQFGRRNAEERFSPLSPNRIVEMTRRKANSPYPTLTLAEEQDRFLRYNYCRYRVMRALAKFPNRKLTAAAMREALHWDELSENVRNEIVEANLGLVPAMVERFKHSGVEFPEMISEGHLALMRAVVKFDVTRGFKFSTYACRAILTSLSRLAMLSSRHRNLFPVEYDPDLQRGDQDDIVRVRDYDESVDDLRFLLSQNIADLTPTEQRILTERFGLGTRETAPPNTPMKTLRQVADEFGVTKERIRQIQNRALEKLREVFATREQPADHAA
ncbi:MAG: sigma-70 family RNA polymerase sigma factor [Phycisphaerales bacterium]|nr:sigma-70 family RNA polymerase sigma factor [Phycisphaerales bacterium]